jgi:4-carboxymuconolactone decarboxylase
MRLSRPRIEPLSSNQEAWTDEQKEVLAPYVTKVGVLNIFATVARNPRAAKAFLSWGGYVRRGAKMSEREREIVILRTGWRCRAGYEWTQHSRLGRAAGLTDDDLERLKQPADAPGWSDREAVLVRAADELHDDYFISDKTWAALSTFLDESERMDLVYLIGHYTQVCMILNTFGIQLEPGAILDKDLDMVRAASAKRSGISRAP